MKNFICIFIGGGLGSISRYFLAIYGNRLINSSFPLGTFIVNILGCFVIGFLWGLFDFFNLTSTERLFIFTGFLGGFTTFSTFMLESFNLLQDKKYMVLFHNLFLSNFIGIIAVIVGFIISKIIIKIMRY